MTPTCKGSSPFTPTTLHSLDSLVVKHWTENPLIMVRFHFWAIAYLRIQYYIFKLLILKYITVKKIVVTFFLFFMYLFIYKEDYMYLLYSIDIYTYNYKLYSFFYFNNFYFNKQYLIESNVTVDYFVLNTNSNNYLVYIYTLIAYTLLLFIPIVQYELYLYTISSYYEHEKLLYTYYNMYCFLIVVLFTIAYLLFIECTLYVIYIDYAYKFYVFETFLLTSYSLDIAYISILLLVMLATLNVSILTSFFFFYTSVYGILFVLCIIVLKTYTSYYCVFLTAYLLVVLFLYETFIYTYVLQNALPVIYKK